MGNLKNTIPKHIFFIIIIKKKTPPTLIRVIRKNKNPERERERERERDSTHNFFFFFCGKKHELNGRNHIKFIQNKMERRRVKI